MRQLPLDTDTAERLLANAVSPDDAPPGYGEVAALLRQAAKVNEPDWSRSASTVSAMAAAVAPTTLLSNPRRSNVFSKLLTTKIAAAGLAGALSLSGVAAAATGVLGDDVQDTVVNLLPGGTDDVTGVVEGGGDPIDDVTDGDNAAQGTHGACVSAVARSKGFATGTDGGQFRNHGARVSAAAHSCPKQAKGLDTTTGSTSTTSTTSTTVANGDGVEPNVASQSVTGSGGSGTANTHSSGNSGHGTDRADDVSNGRSSAGKGNSASHGNAASKSGKGGGRPGR